MASNGIPPVIIIPRDLCERIVTALGYADATFNDNRFTDRHEMGPEFKELFIALNHLHYQDVLHPTVLKIDQNLTP